MCGIIGRLAFGYTGSPMLESRALKAIEHRGPDGTGLFHGPGLSLGHSRLAIIDLSDRATQPMNDPDGNFVIVFNGEIYNFEDIKKELSDTGRVFVTNSDTEVVLQSFKIWGWECVKKFRGMFTFAIWDRKKNVLTLGRDPFGEKPLYLWRTEKTLSFASEMKAILQIEPTQPTLDHSAVQRFLTFGYIPEPQTMFTEVTKLGCGSVLEIECDSGVTRHFEYWNTSCTNEVNPRFQEHSLLSQQLADSFTQASKLTTRSDVPIGIALSGGLDSAAVASVVARDHKDLHAFSVGYSGRPPYDERAQAVSLGLSLNMKCHEIEISTEQFVAGFRELIHALDDPISDPAAFAQMQLFKRASVENIKVILTGIGGDEIFWGYDWVREVAGATSKSNAILQGRLGYLLKVARQLGVTKSTRHFVFELIRRLQNRSSRASDQSSTEDTEAKFFELHPRSLEMMDLCDRYGGKSIINQTRNEVDKFPYSRAKFSQVRHEQVTQLLCDTWLASNCLVLSDRLGMKFGVEVRTPFLDRDFVQSVNLAKQTEQLHLKRSKILLHQLLRGIVPDHIIHRQKQGFRPPVEEWTLEAIKANWDAVLSGPLILAEILDPVRVTIDSKRLEKLTVVDLLFWYRITVLHVWLEHFWESPKGDVLPA